VVVAARAPDRQPEKSSAHRVRDFVQVVLPALLRHHVVGLVRSEAEEARGDEPIGAGVDLIARDLLAKELVEGFVGVEGSQDVVSVAPQRETLGVDRKAVRVGITDDVEPVAPPPRAVFRRLEEAVRGARAGRRVAAPIGEQRLDVFGPRGQTEQIEARSAEPGRSAELRRGSEASGAERLEHEPVHLGAVPFRVAGSGRLLRCERPERPVVGARNAGALDAFRAVRSATCGGRRHHEREARAPRKHPARRTPRPTPFSVGFETRHGA
jgi:hypothetical protein